MHSLQITSSRNKIWVSCECRRTTGGHSKAGKIVYDHIGESANFDETVELYNNPENHWAPFEKKDEIGGKSRRR